MDMKQDVLYSNLTNIPLLHNHFRRPRIDKLLEDALTYPLTIVSAGAGYGKTQAVSAFLDIHNNIIPIWMRLTKLDNLSTRFWESFVYAVNIQNTALSLELHDMGFPNSASLFNLFLQKISSIPKNADKIVLIFDNFHLINEPLVIHFIETLLSAHLKNLCIILISRTTPQLNIPGFFTENLVYQVTEAHLCFTLEEIKDYFNTQAIILQEDILKRIYYWTEGWVSAIYLSLLSLKKDNAATNYALAAAKLKIFELIEQEIFIGYSPQVQNVLISLSLLESSSIDVRIIKEMSDSDVNLMEEIEKTNSFIQYDPITQSYHIHNLFLEFLSDRQKYCTEKEIVKIHYLAAQWYHEQGAIIDALGYYQKCGDYETIWDIIRCYDIDIPQDESALFLELIEEFPDDLLKKEPLIGVVHGRLLLNNGRLEESENELTKIKEAYEALPPTSENKAVIGEACIFLAMISLALRNYKFVELFKTADACLPGGSIFVDNRLYLNNGNYSVAIENPSTGELERFKKAMICSAPYAARVMNGCCNGAEYLTLAESAYYTGDMVKAESNAYKAIYKAKHQRQNDLVCIAYYTLIRTNLARGSYSKASGFLEELIEIVANPNSTDCLSIIDTIKGWFYARLDDMDKVPDWIIEVNKITKVLSPNRTGRERLVSAYCFLKKENYHKLLAYLEYLEEIYEYNSFLIPRLHVQIFKSIAAQKTHDSIRSISALETAYNLAQANSLIMPFIEMGKYMRAVCDEAKRNKDISISREWLDMIYTKSSTYAKHIHNIKAQYRNTTGVTEKDPYSLTSREKDVLRYLCQGLTRKEIANNLYVSSSTVKRTLNNIYGKMGVANSTEAVSLSMQTWMMGSK